MVAAGVLRSPNEQARREAAGRAGAAVGIATAESSTACVYCYSDDESGWFSWGKARAVSRLQRSGLWASRPLRLWRACQVCECFEASGLPLIEAQAVGSGVLPKLSDSFKIGDDVEDLFGFVSGHECDTSLSRAWRIGGNGRPSLPKNCAEKSALVQGGGVKKKSPCRVVYRSGCAIDAATTLSRTHRGSGVSPHIRQNATIL